jgi:hypothetical protein
VIVAPGRFDQPGGGHVVDAAPGLAVGQGVGKAARTGERPAQLGRAVGVLDHPDAERAQVLRCRRNCANQHGGGQNAGSDTMEHA